MKIVLLPLIMIISIISTTFPQYQKIKTDSFAGEPEIEFLSEEEMKRIWGDFKLERVETCTLSSWVENYAVSEDGKIAILFLDEFIRSIPGHINIYNADYSFAYGFSYRRDNNHTAITCISWEDDNLILFTKGDYALYFDLNGNMQRVGRLVNDPYYKFENYLHRRTQSVGDITYELRKRTLIIQTLVAVDENGDEYVIYQSSVWLTIRGAFYVICFIIALTGSLLKATYESFKCERIKKSKKMFNQPNVQGRYCM